MLEIKCKVIQIKIFRIYMWRNTRNPKVKYEEIFYVTLYCNKGSLQVYLQSIPSEIPIFNSASWPFASTGGGGVGDKLFNKRKTFLSSWKGIQV
jgi:hypothetical protein